jgi:phosphatidyl-myo-inositol dimannoside synthase
MAETKTEQGCKASGRASGNGEQRGDVPGWPDLRLFFVARRYWPAVGGVESFLRDLARELAHRHEVTVLARRVDDGAHGRLSDSLKQPPRFEPFTDGGVRVVPLELPLSRRAQLTPLLSYVTPGLRRYAWGRVRLATGALYAHTVAPMIAEWAGGADLLHAWAGDLVGNASVRAAAMKQVPVLLSPFAHPNQYGLGPLDLRAYTSADGIAALLDADASVYRRAGVRPERIFVSGVGSNGVEPGHGERIRSEYGIDGPLVVFLGVRRPYKGFDLLLAAAPIVASEIRNVTFAFVGPGQRLNGAQGEFRVVDAGFASDDDRAGWLEAANVMCLPSEAEIFPVSVLEAWSVRTPVVLTDIPPLRELVEGSQGGLFSRREPRALAEAIISLLSDPEAANSLGNNGHRYWSGGFTVPAVAKRYETYYSTLLSNPRQPSKATGSQG